MTAEQPLKHSVEDSSRDSWLDRLWDCLFDGDSGGLMSPEQIRREQRNREKVRQQEMASILKTEQELNNYYNGQKSLDEQGKLPSSPLIDNVKTHNIIETFPTDPEYDPVIHSPDDILQSVVNKVGVRDLERSLNLRKIAILAESEILTCDLIALSKQAVNAQWLTRWRESAETVFNPELQILWAKIAVTEVARPGSFSLGTLATLNQLDSNDLNSLRIASKYTFDDFIYLASTYFNTDSHQTLFDTVEDLGLINRQQAIKPFHSETHGSYRLHLHCHDKALAITSDIVNARFELPVMKLSRIGRQLLPLCGNETDMAYLFDLARNAKKQGFNVALGDWVSVGDNGFFDQKLVL